MGAVNCGFSQLRAHVGTPVQHLKSAPWPRCASYYPQLETVLSGACLPAGHELVCAACAGNAPAGNDRPGHAAGAAQRRLGRDKHVGHVLQGAMGVKMPGSYVLPSLLGCCRAALLQRGHWRQRQRRWPVVWPSSLLLVAHLVLRQQGQVKQNLDGLGVGSHDHHLADATVQCLGGCGPGQETRKQCRHATPYF